MAIEGKWPVSVGALNFKCLLKIFLAKLLHVDVAILVFLFEGMISQPFQFNGIKTDQISNFQT